MRRFLPWLPLLGILLADPALALPAPARPGDVSLGVGPALVFDRGEAQPAITGEANLLFGLFSVGFHGRLANGSERILPAVGVETSLAGVIGVGASLQPDGPSIDGLLAVPLVFGREPWYFSVGYRPSFLLRGGTIHELAIQIKWSSLLVPSDD